MDEGSTVLLAAVGSQPEVLAEVSLSSQGYTIRPQAPIESSRQMKAQQSGFNSVITISGHPPDTVRDFRPRPLWGLTAAGTSFTLLDAKMQVHFTEHEYTGWLVLHGAHVEDDQIPVSGLRVAFPFDERPGWLSQNAADTEAGQFAPWAKDGRAGIQWQPLAPRPLRRMVLRDTESFRALLSLWTDRPLQPDRFMVEIPGKGWHAVDNLRLTPPEPKASDLLPPSLLTVDVLARWTNLATQLGALPYIALRPSKVLQPDAQNVAAGLEGLHRRLMDTRSRMDPGGKLEGVDKKTLGSARKDAVEAFARSLGASPHRPTDAREVLQSALSHLRDLSYKERLMDLLPHVAEVAPGLLGPDLRKWAQTMVTIRDVQAHQLLEHDDFGEDEIALYYVMEASGRWALRILILLQVADVNDVSRALRSSSRFEHSLANIDRECQWGDFSAFETFKSSSDGT